MIFHQDMLQLELVLPTKVLTGKFLEGWRVHGPKRPSDKEGASVFYHH